MQIHRLGHAALLIETPYVRLLMDPGSYSTDWHGLADLDAVLITHQHPDHVDVDNLAELMGINPAARLITEEAVTSMVAGAELEGKTAAPGETVEVGPVKVEVVGGVHALIHESIPLVGNVGYVLSEGDGARLFHPGDSYGYAPQGVDVLALPITAPWARVGTTADFLIEVSPSEAFPIHDAILSDAGRALYIRMAEVIAGETTSLYEVPPTGSLNI